MFDVSSSRLLPSSCHDQSSFTGVCSFVFFCARGIRSSLEQPRGGEDHVDADNGTDKPEGFGLVDTIPLDREEVSKCSVERQAELAPFTKFFAGLTFGQAASLCVVVQVMYRTVMPQVYGSRLHIPC